MRGVRGEREVRGGKVRGGEEKETYAYKVVEEQGNKEGREISTCGSWQ